MVEGEIPAEGEGEIVAEGEIPAEGEGETVAEGEGENEGGEGGCCVSTEKNVTIKNLLERRIGDLFLIGISLGAMMVVSKGNR